MPTFGTLGKYKIKIHARDHNPPHVHFENGEIVVRIDTTAMAVMSISGRPTRKEVRLMLGYVEQHGATLLEVWNEIQKEN